MQRRLRSAAALTRATWREWQRDNGMMLAAAIAFYATFSIAPLLLLLLNAGALLFGEETARARLLALVADAAGARAAAAVDRILLAASRTDAGATVASVILLLLSASAVFRHLKTALNIVLDVPTKKERGVVRYLKSRAFAAVVVIIGIVLHLSALGAMTGVAWIRENLPEVLGDAEGLWRAAELVVSYSLPAIVFAAVLKFVPDVELKWRHVAIGAGVGALVFVGGQQLISAYLARARVTAAYGAAGSVVLLLLYVYFTAAVILLSAELTERFARDDAEFRSERLQAQAEQGYSPHKEEGAG